MVVGPTVEQRAARLEVVGGLTSNVATHVRLDLAGGRTVFARVRHGAWVAEIPRGRAGAAALRTITVA